MKKYGKFASVGLFVILGVFVLLQYQNCGNSSSTSNTSAVAPDGLTFSVTLSAPTTGIHNVPVTIPVTVVSSGSVQTYAVIGYVANGTKQQMCKVGSPGPSTNWTNSTCQPAFPTAGTYLLYVDILDPEFPPTEYMIECTTAFGPLAAGCAGNYTIAIQ